MYYYSTRINSPPRRKLTTLLLQQHQLIPHPPPSYYYSYSRLYSQNTHSDHQHDYLSRLKLKLKNTKLDTKPIPIWIGISLLVFLTYLKKNERYEEEKDSADTTSTGVKIQGPWQVHVLGALPLRSISRLYGLLNSYTLPIWFRVPGYKLYSWIFGVNLEEAEIEDLKEYKSLNEFFMRKLKSDRRPIDPISILTSPSDGKIINFGTIEGRRVGSVKGLSYSVDALLLGSNKRGTTQENVRTNGTVRPETQRSSEESQVSSKEFANINDISYSIDQLMGTQQQPTTNNNNKNNNKRNEVELTDASINSNNDKSLVKKKVSPQDLLLPGEFHSLPNPGNRMFFFVVYLAPGDYHRFHSPADWVVLRRRHFAGELFSVSPWMAGKLADLFVLNERVALLGRWKYGFFSMTPVGATNVGSINIKFDRELRTNRVDQTTHHEEVVYTGGSSSSSSSSSSTTNTTTGQVLNKGDEVGAFSLGSTIVLVFEAPEFFQFSVKKGASVKVGEAIGNV